MSAWPAQAQGPQIERCPQGAASAGSPQQPHHPPQAQQGLLHNGTGITPPRGCPPRPSRAIARGQSLVEAGAQGEHKLKRGYLPVITHSVHRFTDPRFHAAVARFFVDEAVAVTAERDALALHGPFKAGAAPPLPLVAGLDSSSAGVKNS